MPSIELATGAELAYDDLGPADATPIVLIHGVSMSRRYFRAQLDPLAEEFRVIAVDLRGHGDSADVEAGHTIPQYGRDLRALLDELPLQRPILLGWSMGAFVAWDLIRQFGTASIGGLIVSDEAASDFKWPGFDHGFIDLPTLHALMTSVQDDRRAFLEGLVPQMFHRAPDDADLAWMVAECSKLSIGGTAAILFDQSLQDYRDVLPQIDVPTLVCWGRHDNLLPVSGAAHLGDHIPGAEVVIFEESGHCPFIEESDAFNQTVARFARAAAGDASARRA
jgi:pimeloyl-ACP methyl ester carboxylesterase